MSLYHVMEDEFLQSPSLFYLTLNTEHLSKFQSGTSDFTKSPDNSFSIGFREEGTRVQDGFFIT